MSVAESLFLIPNDIEVGEGDPATPNPGAGYRGNSAAGQVVANWHDEHHFGAFIMCTEQPCEAVRRVDG